MKKMQLNKCQLYPALCLVTSVIINFATAQSDVTAIENVIKIEMEKFELQMMHILQSYLQHHNNHVEQEYACETEFNKLQNITYAQHKEVIEKVASHELNVQLLAESINNLRENNKNIINSLSDFQKQFMGKNNDLIVSQAELQRQLMSQNNDLLVSQSNLQKQLKSQSNVFLASQTDLLKQLKSMNNSLLERQSDHQKQLLSIKTDLQVSQSDSHKQLKGENEVLLMRQSDFHQQLLSKNNDLLESQLNLQKELMSLTKDLKRNQSDVQKQLMNLKDELNQTNINVLPSSCATLNVKATNTYYIRPYRSAEKPFLVLCDFEDNHNLGGGWTVFQSRFNGSENFYQNWTMYKNGFGDVNGEHWLGLERLYVMTRSGRHELLVMLEDFEGYSTYALYDDFKIGSEAEKYKLTVGKYSGTAGDSLDYHNGMKFSTFDQNNEPPGPSCAKSYLGAWWFGDCYHSHLNGKFKMPEVENPLSWNTLKKNRYSLRTTKMMLRRKV